MNGKLAWRRTYLWLAIICIVLSGCQPLPSINVPATAPVLATATAPSPTGTQPGPVANGATPMPAVPATAGPAAAPGAANSPTPEPAAPAAAGPTPTAPSPTPRPAGPIDASRPGQVTVVGARLVEPDDLVTGPDGRVYVSDVGDGTVRRLEPDGSGTVLLAGLREPEGMVFLPGGDLIIAEQGLNRLARYSPATGRLAPLLSLPNTTGQLGVDGIALDARSPGPPTLIIPDSPHGTVLRVGLDGTQSQIIGRGFVRPVAAWVEPDGAILVADEFGNRLLRLHPDGSQATVANLPEPDDVIEDGAGHTYVNTLADGAVHMIDAATGASRVLVRGLLSPQGLALDAQGALLVTDPGRHRVVRIPNP